MRNQKIPLPGVLPKKPKLSVCMIVCDEEKMLPRCLKSVQDVADELIVVDTGSKDDTISIAKGFGAKVYHFEWCDDFAAARNESLKHATGDWIFQIDADEELLSGSIPLLKARMLKATVLYYLIKCDNGPRCLTPRFDWIGRMFRRHPNIRYHRPYHETVSESAQELMKVETRWQSQYEPNIIICHYGYEQPEIQRKYEKGIAIMKSYLEAHPDDAYMLTRLGSACGGLRSYDEAEIYLKRALAIHPDSADANYSLGLTLQEQNKLEPAIRCYKKAIAANSDLAEAYVNLGFIYIQKGMLDDSISELKRALAINPALSTGHINLGLVYRDKGMLDESIAELKQAVAINPNLSTAYINLGSVYHMKGMFNEAVAQYKHALSIDPKNADAYFNLGIAYRNQGMKNEAIEEYKTALAINPDLAEAHNNLAVAYYLEKEYEMAKKHCDKAMELGFKVDPKFLRKLKAFK